MTPHGGHPKFTGDPNGQGRLDWDSGAYFIGTFKNGKRQGYGKFVFNDGAVEKGYWDKDMIKLEEGE